MTATTLTGSRAQAGLGRRAQAGLGREAQGGLGLRAQAGLARRAHVVVNSPVGPLTLLAVDGKLAGLYLSEQRYRPAPGLFGEPDFGPFAEAAGQLADYFDGRRTSFDLPLAQNGTAFQVRVWTALQSVPFGATISYGQLADRIGQPSAARAVGLANGRNPISIIVPCHRVVGSDGSLTGYGGGLERKRYLLALERRIAAAMGVPRD